MDKKLEIKTITIKDLWNVFRGCVHYILIVAIALMGFMYWSAKNNYVPTYSSTATLYLVGEVTSSNSPDQWTRDYTLAYVVIDDSQYLLKSRTVLDQVGEELGIKNGYSALRGRININNPEETRVIEVTAVAASPTLAKDIVDSVCRVGSKSINDVLGYDQVRVFESGTLSASPNNSVKFSNYIKYGIIAALVVYMVFLAIFLFDNYIHTESDIEHYLGLTVLAEIPDADSTRTKKRYAYAYKKRANKSDKNE